METVAAMIQLSTGVSAHDSAPPPTVEEVSAASAELNSPLLRRVKLSNDIARMRRLLRRLVRNANSHRLGGRSRGVLVHRTFNFTPSSPASDCKENSPAVA
jgi:hypothetical protein